MNDAKLSDLQLKFIDAYLVEGNDRKAAILAGYSEASAKTTGPRQLSNPVIAAAIVRRKALVAQRCERTVTPEMVISGLLDEATDRSHKSASARVAAWSTLARHLGMLQDRVDVTGDVSVLVGKIERHIVSVSDKANAIDVEPITDTIGDNWGDRASNETDESQ